MSITMSAIACSMKQSVTAVLCGIFTMRTETRRESATNTITVQ